MIAWEKLSSDPLGVLVPGPDAANAFAASQGLARIGFNWELLDPHSDFDAPRSAIGTMTQALSKDLSNPSRTWLDQAMARKCAQEFLGAFDAARMMVLTNHLNGLWWPISDAQDEWTFVAMDDRTIGLLMLAK